jgi:hypothetical protein
VDHLHNRGKDEELHLRLYFSDHSGLVFIFCTVPTGIHGKRPVEPGNDIDHTWDDLLFELYKKSPPATIGGDFDF